MNRQSEELFDKYLTETLTPSESRSLAELLEKDEDEGHHLGDYLLETALMLKVCGDLETQHRMFGTSSPSAIRRLPSRFWLLGLAAAASLAIVAGVWWFNQGPAAGLGLRVAEVRGKAVIGYRLALAKPLGEAGLSVIGNRESGVTESTGHQVAKSGDGGRLETRNSKLENAGSPLATRHSTLKVGDVLRPGDGIEVGADGYVKLAYPDTTQVELQQNTRLRVTLGVGPEKTAKRLALDGGKFVCSAAPQKRPFEIKTPHAIARVVGTRFGLMTEDVKTTLAVLEGKVALCQGEKILEVGNGQEATATETGMALGTGTMGTEPQTGTPVDEIAFGESDSRMPMSRRLWWNPQDMTLEGEESPINSGAAFLYRWSVAGATNTPIQFLGKTSIDNTKRLIRLADGRLLGLDAPWTGLGQPTAECAPVELQPNARRFGPAVVLDPSTIRMTACDKQGRYFMVAMAGTIGRVLIWDLDRGVLVTNLTTRTTPQKTGVVGFMACAVAPDAGVGVVVDSASGIQVLNLPGGTLRQRMILPMSAGPQAYGADLTWEDGALVCRGWPNLMKDIRVDPMAGADLERSDHPVIRHGDMTIHVRAGEIEVVRQGTEACRIPMPLVKSGNRQISVTTVAAGWRCSPDGHWLAGTLMTGVEQVLVDLQEGRCVSPQAEDLSQRPGDRSSRR